MEEEEGKKKIEKIGRKPEVKRGMINGKRNGGR